MTALCRQGREELRQMMGTAHATKWPRARRDKQSVRQGKLVQFSRFQSCPAKVSRPAGIDVVVPGGNK